MFPVLAAIESDAQMWAVLIIFFGPIVAIIIWAAIITLQEKRQEAQDKASGDYWRKKIARYEEYIADTQHDLEKFERREGRRTPPPRTEPIQPEDE